MKHRHLNAATAWKAGYTAPATPKSASGGGRPNKQPFNVTPKPRRKKRRAV